MKEFTKATGVYVGVLGHPKKDITDDDDDKAHLDEEAPKVIQFLHASKGHEFMEGQILRSDQGISHDAFIVEEPAATEEQDEAAEPKP